MREREQIEKSMSQLDKDMTIPIIASLAKQQQEPKPPVYAKDMY